MCVYVIQLAIFEYIKSIEIFSLVKLLMYFKLSKLNKKCCLENYGDDHLCIYQNFLVEVNVSYQSLYCSFTLKSDHQKNI